MFSPSRIITSYLGHPYVRDFHPGVLRAGICQKPAWYAGRQDIRIGVLVPTAAEREAWERGDEGVYRRGLPRTYLMPGRGTIILLCWEGDPVNGGKHGHGCHRRAAFEVMAGRPWTWADELHSRFGGTAEV